MGLCAPGSGLRTKLCTHHDLLLKKSLSFDFMVVVDQLQVHVHKEWIEELRKLSPVTVQH